MNRKNKIIIVGIALAGAFAAGRFTVPEKIKIQKELVQVEKKVDKTSIDALRNKHKETKTIEVVKPNGEKNITTIVVEDTNADKKTSTMDNTQVLDKQVDSKEITSNTSKVTISLLAGVSPFTNSSPLTYGVSATKPILGPVTIGLFGLSTGVIGCSVGLTF